MRLYYKFLGGNLSKNLEYCPSPGENQVKPSVKHFSSDFNFDEEWVRLLYSISTDFNNPEGETIGGCGVCFL